MEITTGAYTLTGLDRINVILGRNGCGKSTLLKAVRAHTSGLTSTWAVTKYVTPERGGTLSFEQGIEGTIRSSPNWLDQVLAKNQFNQYKQQSIYQFEKLQLAVLQKIAMAVEAGTTPEERTYLADINSLLDNIEISETVGEKGFKIQLRSDGTQMTPEQISSGESELISLGIECLAFAQSVDPTKFNILVLDEPDVHLHPDLQGRLMRFLNNIVVQYPSIHVLMATHSTAILGELSRYGHTTVSPMVSGQTSLEFERIDDTYRRILPVFGAHPLSSVYREQPLLLVEGSDEQRIWQQAIRTSQGRIHFYPIETNGLGDMPKFEERAKKVASAVYDHATFYSLRDRDNGPEDTVDDPPIVRLKLSCRASENLLLSNEVLARSGTTWDELRSRIDDWLANSSNHSRFGLMKSFAEGGFDRKAFDLKQLRILLVDLVGSDKPWEVLVGQAIGELTIFQLGDRAEGSLASFLGAKFTSVLERMVST